MKDRWTRVQGEGGVENRWLLDRWIKTGGPRYRGRGEWRTGGVKDRWTRMQGEGGEWRIGGLWTGGIMDGCGGGQVAVELGGLGERQVRSTGGS